MAGFGLTALFAILAGFANANGLADIEHVVLFMQENRAFDHYFGTMAGVRGFKDANLQMNDGVPVWKQLAAASSGVEYVSPWYLNYLGGTWFNATQCMVAGSNGWHQNHAAWNSGSNNRWAVDNTPWSIGFYKKADLPTQFALAEGWVVADMYQEAVVAATNPNRVTWMSGSINAPGSPQRPDQGGNPYIDNNEVPGCTTGGFNCYPLKWKTVGEHFEDAGVSWQVFQDADNFDDNPFAWFDQFQRLDRNSQLYRRAIKGLPLADFYQRAASGTLPELSIIVGPTQLSEHPPYSPHDGAWLQDKIARAVMNSPKYESTALIISFDETGGFSDHLDPYRSPKGTAAEWIDDPYKQVGYTFLGPGFRVPFYIISPWTRNGGVYTEHSDHNSQILFLEKWQAARSRNVTTDEMVAWRRQHMGDLVNAFDFENPDYTIPVLPVAPEPHRNSRGHFDGSSHCRSQYPRSQPPVPYTGEGVIEDMASVAEHGFKAVRGKLTEGRYLVFEMNDLALTNPASGDGPTLTRATENHESSSQRWIIHASEIGGNDFTIQSFVDDRYICQVDCICMDKARAVVFELGFEPSKGHTLKTARGYLTVENNGKLTVGPRPAYWNTFSVSY